MSDDAVEVTDGSASDGSESDGSESLVYDQQGPTVVLTMNRPERMNTLTLDMISARNAASRGSSSRIATSPALCSTWRTT